jgi:agmatine deiminase
MQTPKKLGFHFPAEWEKHNSTWLSYPHNDSSWPGKIHTIFPFYHTFIKEISKGELVNINVQDDYMKDQVQAELMQIGVDLQKIIFHLNPTNDAWCRDHGPAFLVNSKANPTRMIVNWEYNAWGDKYPHELDNEIPKLIANYLNLPYVSTGIVMEGGSVDFNGDGTLLTTTACLLHTNRNPTLKQADIEKALIDFYGIEQVLWLGDGIAGDDTNGHIDDLTRFTTNDTVITMVEPDKNDENHAILNKNLAQLKKMRLFNGKQLNIAEIPLPEPLYFENQRLPVSYANFYVCNAAVIVPVFGCRQDQQAIDILAGCFRDRPVIGIDSVEIIWGLGSWHCLSQQEPAI